MDDNKTYMPHSSGGLINYGATDSKIKFNKWIIIGFIVVIICFYIILTILHGGKT